MDWNELKARLIGLGLTQQEISRRSGVPQPSLSLLLRSEGGHATPSLRNYLALASFYERYAKRKPRKKAEA
jgi:transcriptional regulator with XRE-family HTH domain